MKIQNSQFLSTLQINEKQTSIRELPGQKRTDDVSFKDILHKEADFGTEALKFSKHATVRLSDRNISLSVQQLERLSEGTQKASEKGIKDSLVIVDQLAFIVNVPNNTVVTAMDQAEARENVFTNIDGAVIA
ncbi:MAG: flagellar protein [Lachnospiraceae bacterium]|nr:flagellar protein [Lachnospiraceae bacterium]